jgi:Holliday junction resolvase RusA-like endonuclease
MKCLISYEGKMIVNTKPISINYAFQGRRFKNKAYKDYEELLLWILKEYKGEIAKSWYKIEFDFHMKNYKMADISNCIKVTEDIIVKAGIVKDDKYCVDLHVKKFKAEKDWFEFRIIPLKEEHE